MQSPTDTQLQELARKRVDFRKHLVVYFVINSVLWLIWLVTGHGYFWPVWPTAGWGIGLLFHYIFEYRQPRLFSEKEEFKKLKGEME